MANRLTKIYTRTGDDGSTGKADGSRVAKDDGLIAAIGDIDELNSQLAVVVCHAPDDYVSFIKKIQNTLFDVGGQLAMSGMEDAPVMLVKKDVDQLEQALLGAGVSIPGRFQRFFRSQQIFDKSSDGGITLVGVLGHRPLYRLDHPAG